MVTRDQAEDLVRRGVAQWDGGDLVYVRPPEPLTHRGVPIPCASVIHTRVRFLEKETS